MPETNLMRFFIIGLFSFAVTGCRQHDPPKLKVSASDNLNMHPIAAAAIALTRGPFVVYDPAYKSIPYPGGDVAPDRGVCADVVVRALRNSRLRGDTAGPDLQQLVHEDMVKNFSRYPKCWGLRAPDANIDHRRVPNLMTFFEHHLQNLPANDNPDDYLPGDIVAWLLKDGRTHIGIVVDGLSENGWPLVVHNIGRGQEKANVLFCWKIIGHYRYPLSL